MPRPVAPELRHVCSTRNSWLLNACLKVLMSSQVQLMGMTEASTVADRNQELGDVAHLADLQEQLQASACPSAVAR